MAGYHQHERDKIQTMETKDGCASLEEFYERPRVCLAVDDSEHSLYAFDWYRKFIHKQENIVILVHVPDKEDLAEWGPKAEKQARKLEDRYFEKMSQAGFQGKIRVVIGKAGEALIKAALEEHCVMIITGTRGMGAIKRTFVSSFSDYLVHNSPIPVLVCRKKGHGQLETEDNK